MRCPIFVKGILKRYLPQSLLETIDWPTLTLQQLDGHHISDNLQCETQADVVYRATVSKRLGFFWFHIEHQSSPDRLLPLRILNYQTGLLLNYTKTQRCQQVPLLITFIYYHGKSSPYPYSLDWRDTFENPDIARHYAGVPILIDLNQEEDMHIQALTPDTAGAELAFKYIYTSDFNQYLDKVLQALKSAPGEVVSTVLEYLIKRANISTDTLVSQSLIYLPEEEETIMQIYRKNQQQYLDKGRQEVASNLFRMGYSFELVKKMTGLPETKLLHLQKESVPA